MITNKKPLQYTQLNRSPYFDDYDPVKGFYRILFRPAKIQARELNQSQSILQNQIGKFGSHVFTEGSVVIPGGLTTILNQASLQVEFTTSISAEEINSRKDNLYVTNRITDLNAKVQAVSFVNNKTFLFIDTINSGFDGEVKSFSKDDGLVLYEQDSEGNTEDLALATVKKVTEGAWAKLNSGTYFVRNHFIDVDSQYVILEEDIDGLELNYKVGFKVVENVITENEDSSLYSNAQGYPNFKGPGAHRLKISLQLTKKSSADAAEDIDFVELIRTDNSIVYQKQQDSTYSILNKTLAKRTYEESGDYTVSPFEIEIKEHLKQNIIDGVYTQAEGGDPDKFVIQVKPGICYVKGYRVENLGIKNLDDIKSRDVFNVNNTVTGVDSGPYILVKDLNSLPDIDIHKRISLRNSSNAVIGSCVLRGIRKLDTNSYNVYLFDIQILPSYTFSQVNNIYYSDPNNLFKATLIQANVFNVAESSLVFTLPYNTIKTLKLNGYSDTTYSVLRTIDTTTDSSGSCSITLSNSEMFSPINNYEYLIGYGGAGNDGTVISNASSYLTLGGSVLGRTININLGATHANKKIKLIAPIIKQSPVEKTKTLKTATETVIISQNTYVINLSKADITDINFVKDENGKDITSMFTLNNGQTQSWYENGSVSSSTQILASSISPKQFDIEYNYFEHGVGDFFTVDSYIDIKRENIPSIIKGKQEVSLADCIDFRPLKSDSLNYNVTSREIIRPGDMIRCDLSYYLPRIDSLYVDSDGTFDIVRGVSEDNPKVPDVPNNAMRLYDLYIPAYTNDIKLIGQKYIGNKRYTMRDIGKLEKRIENVEYYTLLNALESKVNKIDVIDPNTGNNRFKNGFVADGFSDFRLASTDNIEWGASIDANEGKLKPSFVENGITLEQDSLLNTQIKNDIFTLPYTETSLIEQPFATRTSNINPYAVFVWIGNIILTPNSDFWKDVVYNPPIVINKTVNTRGAAVPGTVWNSWNTVSTNVSITGLSRSTTTNQVRTGTATTFTESFNSSSTDNFLSTSVIPYMRSIDIKWECKGFKPFTRIYPFFDNVDVSTKCMQNGKGFKEPIITDSTGYVAGHFIVPSENNFKFRTGTSIFRFSDSSTNSQDTSKLETWGETSFSSGGIMDTRQVTTTNVRTLGVRTNNVSESRSSTITSRIQSSGGRDPIAQSFTIPTTGGAFITKIDVYFATKSNSIPVSLQIRYLNNGMPETSTIPFGEVVLNASEVKISNDASIPTSFVFRDPIYLEDTAEFCFVLLANTQEYNVYISQMGENVIGQKMAVSKQPHTGVFFGSSNGSTWNPDQLKDIKFKIHRAKFDNTQSESSVILNGSDIEVKPLKINPVKTISGSNIVTVYAKSHGVSVGDTFTISNFVTGNGILDSDMNKSHVATEVGVDYINFLASNNANASGNIGGNVMKITSGYPISCIYSNISNLMVAGTDIKYFYSYKDKTGNLSAWQRLTLNETIDLASEGVYKSKNDFKIKAVFTSSSDTLSPCIELGGSGVSLITKRVNSDVNNSVFNYVTQDVIFNNPSTMARIFVGAKLPGTSTMKVYYKLMLVDEALDTKPWNLLNPNTPISNDAKVFKEYEYQINSSSFIGAKFKVVLLSDDVINTPELSDFSFIALA